VAALRKAREAARRDLTGPDGAVRNRRFAEDSLKLGDLLLDAGELAEAEKVLGEGLVAARKDDDPPLITRVRRARGRALLATGNLDEAARDLDGAMQAALGLRDRGLLADLHADTGELHERRGDLTRAAEYLLRALELTEGGKADEIRRTALRCLNALGRVYLRWKNPDKAALFFQQALELAETMDDRLGAERALGNLGAVYHQKSQLDTAVKFVEQALAIAQEIGDQIGVARQQHNLGTLCLAMGHVAKAQPAFEAAYQAARRVGWREGMATAASSLDRIKAAAAGRRP
jgi:tetratricopeptide (TPR) repeat protein